MCCHSVVAHNTKDHVYKEQVSIMDTGGTFQLIVTIQIILQLKFHGE